MSAAAAKGPAPRAGAAGDLALLLDAAAEAAALALKLQREGLKVRYKAPGSPVTNADLAVDALLTERLRAARPDYGWLSEETSDDPARLSAGRLFIVDPIDGTTAFFKHRPWWTVSLAVVEAGRPLAGVVVAPALGETYAATEGGGATLNGQPIRARDGDGLEGCAMLAPLDTFSDPRWARTPGGAWPPMRVERRNALSLRLALVAAGSFDAAVSLGPKHDWDLAGGAVIADEAGALATDRLGRPLRFNTPGASSRSLVCAGPTLHRLILDRVEGLDLAD